MTISVVVITYNHEKYIGKALDSILSQKGEFELEVLVGNDCSTDRTEQVLNEYQNKYPEIIKVYNWEKNIGATRNSYELFTKSSGEYVAILEGDDFWTDDNKLSKQLAFLEEHKEYSGCSCRFSIVDEVGIRYSQAQEDFIKGSLYAVSEEYGWEDYWAGNMPGQAGTLLIRNVFKVISDTTILYKAHNTIGDFTVIMLALSMGNIYVMNDMMSAYRRARYVGDSWSVKASNEYTSCQIFGYHCTLDKYIKNVIGVKGHQNLMDRVFFSFAGLRFRTPTNAKKRMLRSMIKQSGRLFHFMYLSLVARYVTRIEMTILTMNVNQWHKVKNSDWGKLRYNDFWKQLDDKELILYGAGGGCKEFINKWYDKVKIKCIVDKNEKIIGKYIYGNQIHNLDILDQIDKEKSVVVITPGNCLDEIYKNLVEYGFENIFSFVCMELNTPSKRFYRNQIMDKDYAQILA